MIRLALAIFYVVVLLVSWRRHYARGMTAGLAGLALVTNSIWSVD